MNCLFCNSSNKFSEEHIIPKSIGGSITINNVCIDCNSKFGSEVDIKLTKNKHIYDSYTELSKIHNLNLKFSFKDAYYEISNGQKIKAVNRSNTRKVLTTKTDDNNFIIDNNDPKFVIQSLRKKGKRKNLSDSIINKVIEDYKKWNSEKKGDEFYNELFEITVQNNEDNATFNYIMDADTPHRFIAKACVEFAYLFNIDDQIKNIEVLKFHALYGNQIKNISVFQEVHKEITPCPFHYIKFDNSQFVIGLFCQFNFALNIYWKDKTSHLKFANNLLTKKLVYCEEKNERLKSTDREFIHEVTYAKQQLL